MRVRFLDLEPQTNRVKKEYLKAVKKILDRNDFVLTKEVADFERDWAKAVGVKYAVGVSSGADALYLALKALEIGEGDEVITQGNAYNASVTAILRVGAKPVFVDIDAKTWELDFSKIEQAITKKTKAIMPVHLYGLVNNMPVIMKIANRYNLKVVEDCAQAHLASLLGRKAGSFGQANGFSFYPTKNLGAFGQAGAVTMNDRSIYEKVLMLRDLGQKAKYDHRYLGYNMRMDPMDAAALSLKLRHLRAWTRERQKSAAIYRKLILKANLPVQMQEAFGPASHVYHLFAVQLPNANRSRAQKELGRKGVQTAVHYPLPVYRQPFYKYTKPKCPNADRFCERVLSLPFYVGIKKSQQEYVIKALKSILL